MFLLPFVNSKFKLKISFHYKLNVFGLIVVVNMSSFKSFYSNNDITHQVFCPFTLEQNGCAERKHRHIVEIGLALLFNAHMPSNYWVDAFLIATYLINRIPIKSLHSISHWETLFQTPPDYSTLRVFGSACYPWLRPYSHNKFDPRSK